MSNIEDLRFQLEALQQRTLALEAAHACCGRRIRELHEQNVNLLRLTAASRLLALSPARNNVLSAIEEIVVGMVGGRELGIFDIDHVQQTLRPARLRGVDADSPRVVRAMDLLCEVVRTGEILVGVGGGARAHSDTGDVELCAAVPLKLEGFVTGVLAIYTLTDRKARLEPVDYQLFDILSGQGAIALHSTAFQSLRPTVRPPPNPHPVVDPEGADLG